MGGGHHPQIWSAALGVTQTVYMNQVLTTHQRSLSRKYLVYQTLSNLWFVSAIWLYFYRIFITDQQVGLMDGFAFAIGLIAEVPSGALADRFGRDRIVKLGQLLAGTGFLIQAFGSSIAPFFVGQAIMMIGVAFVSGAEEALFFRNLNFDRASVQWRRLITRGSQCALVGGLLATIAGGWLYAVNPRMPWVLTGLSLLGSIFIVWSVKDSRPEKHTHSFTTELRKHLADIKAGFLQFGTPQLWVYVPIILAVQGLFYAAGWGILRIVLLDRFYFTPFMGSVVIASSSLITVGVLAYMHKYAEHLSEKRVIVCISLSAVASLVLSLADIGVWGYVVIFSLYAGEHVLHPFMSETLNSRAGEDQRATVLSVASFLRTLPYVLLAPIIGYLNAHGNLEFFLMSWSLLIGMAVMVYLFSKKTDAHINLTKEEIGVDVRIPDLQ